MPDLITIVFPKAEKASVILGYISVQLVLKKPTADASNQPSCLSTSILQLLRRIIKKVDRAKLKYHLFCCWHLKPRVWAKKQRGDCWWTAPCSWWRDRCKGYFPWFTSLLVFPVQSPREAWSTLQNWSFNVSSSECVGGTVVGFLIFLFLCII